VTPYPSRWKPMGDPYSDWRESARRHAVPDNVGSSERTLAQLALLAPATLGGLEIER
jgi:hypothetical protein